MLDNLRALWTTEPARLVTFLTGLALAAAAKLGVVIDADTVWEALALLGAVMLGGEAIRQKVSPAAPGEIGPASDDLLPRYAEGGIVRGERGQVDLGTIVAVLVIVVLVLVILRLA